MRHDPFAGLAEFELRTALRVTIMVGSVACVVLAVPRMLAAPTLKDAKEAAMLGILLPLSVIFSLYWDRMEGFGNPETKADDPTMRSLP